MAVTAVELQRFVGVRIGNWKILRPLGQGAFGAVFEAESVTIAGRRAAVKLLHGHMATNSAIKQRFLNEASAASRAEHENVVQVFDGGITPEGLCYVVMELLRGHTLSTLIRQGPLGLRRTVHIGAQVASALEAVHQLGIVHRDLKPDNIFVIQRGKDREFVKVLDFGVAKLHDAPGDGGSLTKTGMMIGTPAYMSPEQWMTLPDVDGRADIYSLGIILYLCLTRSLPFTATTPFEWLKLHLEEPIPDPSGRGEVTPEMGQLLLGLLAKRREDRPQTMAEVAAALEEVLAAADLPVIDLADDGVPVVELTVPKSGHLRGPSGISPLPVAPAPAPAPAPVDLHAPLHGAPTVGMPRSGPTLAQQERVDRTRPHPRRGGSPILAGVVAVLALGAGAAALYWRYGPPLAPTTTDPLAVPAAPAEDLAPLAAAPALDLPPTAAPPAEVAPPPTVAAVAPPALEEAHLVGERAFAEGDLEQARRLARGLIEQDPNDGRAWRLLGLAACGLRDQVAANEALAHLAGRERADVKRGCDGAGIALAPPEPIRPPTPIAHPAPSLAPPINEVAPSGLPRQLPTLPKSPEEGEGDAASHRLTQAEVNAGMSQIDDRLSECLSRVNFEGKVVVNLLIAPSGHVQSARVHGDLANTVAGQCVVKAAESALFRKFAGEPMPVVYAFRAEAPR